MGFYMNEKQKTKIKARIEEIEKFLDNNRDYSKFDSHALFMERSELEFKRNSENINFTLRNKRTKYYNAFQCYEFTKNLLKNGYNGFNNATKKEIKKEGICFNKYSINVGYNQYCKDLKRFDSKEEMFGFVIGYNEAVRTNKTV
jgi:hypothetical protein